MASLTDAFAKADFVSINMPYIKGVTHGIIDAYKNGRTGKYICDFPDEFMQGHPKFISIPHLGASTEEAEDNCAEMAARSIIDYLETGTIKNSVNFPEAKLARQEVDTTRLCIIHENRPGMLGQLTTLLGDQGVNIVQQLNTSREEIAYNVVDLQDVADADALLSKLLEVDGVLSSRMIWTGTAAEGPSSFKTKVQ